MVFDNSLDSGKVDEGKEKRSAICNGMNYIVGRQVYS